jgi:hypothetical protein
MKTISRSVPSPLFNACGGIGRPSVSHAHTLAVTAAAHDRLRWRRNTVSSLKAAPAKPVTLSHETHQSLENDGFRFWLRSFCSHGSYGVSTVSREGAQRRPARHPPRAFRLNPRGQATRTRQSILGFLRKALQFP